MKGAKSAPPKKKSPAAQSTPAESELLAGLNEAQKEAVLFGTGPLLIVAGAGTGKTTVLTKRIAQLISSKACLPSEILALTFTDKAAREMEERVDKLVPYGFTDVWISTFHSFGDRVLREFAFEIGLSPDVRVMTQPEAAVFLRQNIFSLNLKKYMPLADPSRFVSALLTAFSRAKDEDISPDQFIAAAREQLARATNQEEREEAEKNLEVGMAYQKYEELKTKRGFIDFGDQVVLCLKIFRDRPSVLKKYQDKFKYILVDEFQDTNFTQFESLKLLAAPHRNITVVGDDDQSIYKFRGACLSNILGFRKSYPDAHEIVLGDNYRSHQEILDAAYKLIQHNNPDRLEYQDKLSKMLRAAKGSGKKVSHLHFDTLFAESDFVAKEIKSRIEARKNAAKDFAILVRANASAEPFIKSLQLAGIPWRFSGNAGLYEQDEIRLALSFLRSLDDPQDSASLFYLATSSIYELDGDTGARLSQAAGKSNRPLYDVFMSALKNEVEGLTMEQPAREIIRRIVDDIAKYRKLAPKIPTGQLLYRYIEETGVLTRLASSEDWKAVQEAQNLHHFFEVIKKFGQVSQYDRVHYFIEYLEALRNAGEDPASAEAALDDDAVNILTVHAAKGLEFPVVFIASVEQGHFPSNDRGDAIELPDSLIKDILPSTANPHSQEERRLFYVGMTRAKYELILCSARDHGKKKMWKPSQFVLEALDTPSVAESVIPSKPIDALKAFAPNAAPLNEKPRPLPNTEATEENPLTLSATGIKDYMECPAKYKYSRALRLPVMTHHTAVFGTAVHEALKVFNLMRRENKLISLDEYLAVYKNAWRSEGFLSREHEDTRFEEGAQILRSYYASESQAPQLPTLVEEDFRIALPRARIRGRWDRVDIAGKEATILDYKTGDVKDQNDADKKAKESIQLMIYSAAFHERYGYLPQKASLLFIKNNLVGTTVPTDKKVTETIDKAQQVVFDIADQKFNATPGYHCRWCAYEKICPSAEK